MSKKNNIIKELELMLDKPSMVLENFIVAEDLGQEFGGPTSFDGDMQNGYGQEEMGNEQAPQMKPEMQKKENPTEGIEKELTQIRKIALNVITRLADNPNSENYQLMKKIWNTVDKAIENANNQGNEAVNA